MFSFSDKGNSSRGGIIMKQETLTIKKFNEMINKWTGKEIKIIKDEANDIDETIISLENVSYKENLHRIDDYEPKYELRLTGSGFIENDEGEFEPLPNSVYEIALDDETEYRFKDNKFHLKTDRGTYSIQIMSPKE